MTEVTSIHSVATRLRRMARPPHVDPAAALSQTAGAPAAKPQSKSSLVLELLARPEGVTLDQLAKATGWLAHTTRAALTGLKKKGHVLTSDKIDGSPRIYRVVTDADPIPTDVDSAVVAEPTA